MTGKEFPVFSVYYVGAFIWFLKRGGVLDDKVKGFHWKLQVRFTHSMSVLLQRAKPSSPAFSLCASARSALSLSSRDQTIFFLLLLKAVTVSQFSFICGRYELYLFFCNWFLFSFLSTRLSEELCALQSSVNVCSGWSCACAAAASAQLPGPAHSILATACAPSAPWDTLLLWTTPALLAFLNFLPCPALLLKELWTNSTWNRLECLQVSLPQDECLSFQSAHLQQVIPGSQDDLLHLLLLW